MNTVALILIVIVTCLLGYFITLYSQILSLRDRFKTAFTALNFQLKQRYSQIPYLIQTTRSYISHDNNAIQSLSRACNRATNAADIADAYPTDVQLFYQLIDAEAALKSALSHFYEFIQTSPNLNSDSRLIIQINEIMLTEEKVSNALQTFNDAVMVYNHYRERFPSNLITRLFRFREAAFFQLEANELQHSTWP